MGQPSYQVGYGRPPEHTRFQKGQSGNPGGRPGPKKLLKRDFDRALCKALDADEKTFRAARPMRIVEIAAHRAVLQALDGRLPALKLILSVLEKGDCDLGMEESEDARGEDAIDSLSQGKSQGFSEKRGGRYSGYQGVSSPAHNVPSPAHEVPSPASEPRAGEGSQTRGTLAAKESESTNSLSQGNSQGFPENGRVYATTVSSPASGRRAGEGTKGGGTFAQEKAVSTDSLAQGNSQAISEKARGKGIITQSHRDAEAVLRTSARSTSFLRGSVALPDSFFRVPGPGTTTANSRPQGNSQGFSEKSGGANRAL